jgi:predicted S18 family serine protease
MSAAEQRFFASVPALGVTEKGGKLIGTTHYVAIQLDRLTQPVGPEVQFNEGSRSLGRLTGAAVSADWKDAARVAVQAAAQAMGEDPRMWLVTLKNSSNAYLTDGPSAGASLAVAFAAALRETPILPGVILTGAINPDGHISSVGGIPEKIQGAASAGFLTILIPPGQTTTPEWDIRPLAESLRITIIEVRTLREAFEKMTGRPL